MYTNTLWLLALSVSTPIASVVGFAIQLRQVRKTKLENEKLALETASLKLTAKSREQRIQRVTTDEVLRYSRGDVMFSRSSSPNQGPDYNAPSSRSGNIVGALAMALALLVVCYAIYDISQLIRWVLNAV